MRVKTACLIFVCVAMLGCSPVENQARDAAAALSGSIVAAQSRYQATCTTNPAQEVCRVINRGVSAQNSLITAIETYCGWSVSPGPADPNAKCVPMRSAEATLKAAIANASALTKEIKGAM